MSADAVDRHLAALDEIRPALVSAHYLTGSVAPDDFHAASSDVDFIAVVARISTPILLTRPISPRPSRTTRCRGRPGWVKSPIL